MEDEDDGEDKKGVVEERERKRNGGSRAQKDGSRGEVWLIHHASRLGTLRIFNAKTAAIHLHTLIS